MESFLLWTFPNEVLRNKCQIQVDRQKITLKFMAQDVPCVPQFHPKCTIVGACISGQCLYDDVFQSSEGSDTTAYNKLHLIDIEDSLLAKATLLSHQCV